MANSPSRNWLAWRSLCITCDLLFGKLKNPVALRLTGFFVFGGGGERTDCFMVGAFTDSSFRSSAAPLRRNPGGLCWPEPQSSPDGAGRRESGVADGVHIVVRFSEVGWIRSLGDNPPLQRGLAPCGAAVLDTGGGRSTLLFFASPKKSNQKKGDPSLAALRAALGWSGA